MSNYRYQYLNIIQENKKFLTVTIILQILQLWDSRSSFFKWENNLSEHTIEDIDQHPDYEYKIWKFYS